ncbi:MAG: hypothetical protein ACXABY_34310 [Candidatus Thorarchaeota archaeon]|jgi:hypothetical protein
MGFLDEAKKASDDFFRGMREGLGMPKKGGISQYGRNITLETKKKKPGRKSKIRQYRGRA